MRLNIKTKEYELLEGTARTLVQQVGDGSIIKRFEKTPLPSEPNDVVCPHFLELKWATGCPFNCAWCYLNGTLRFQPGKKRPYFKGSERIASHVMSFLNEVTWCNEILNTGELADSLMWENNGKPFSKFILSLFAGQARHKLLFLSKSTAVQGLLETDGENQAIISFSLNAEPVADRWEKGAPSVSERIDAARRVSEAGYEVRIRIDPMVPVHDWREHYKRLLDQIFEKFVPSRVTLGSLRGLQSTINNSPDKSWVQYLRETSRWGKKVDFNIRFWMYRFLIDHLKQHDYDNVALCKETKELWEKLGMNYKEIKCNCIL